MAIDNNDERSDMEHIFGKVAPYLAALKRNTFCQVKDSLSLVTRGYVVDSKHKDLVASWRHLQHAMNHPAERFTFETPSDPTRFVAEPTSERRACSACTSVWQDRGTAWAVGTNRRSEAVQSPNRALTLSR